MIDKLSLNGITFGLDSDLSRAELQTLAAELGQAAPRSEHSLGGRSAARFLNLGSWGKVVVKTYRRGGFWGRVFMSSRYLRLGCSRPELEFRRLEMVRHLGVNAPRPLCFAIRGGLLYSGWLVTQEIEQQQSLAELSLKDPERARAVIPELARQVRILIEANIFHVDLHPGNVLVTPDNQVFLIDFDKAMDLKSGAGDLRDQYVRRWRRAVIKHMLPEELSEVVCLKLRAMS